MGKNLLKYGLEKRQVYSKAFPTGNSFVKPFSTNSSHVKAHNRQSESELIHLRINENLTKSHHPILRNWQKRRRPAAGPRDILGKLRIGECDITPSDSVPNLGVIFDEDGMMTSQIDSINKSAYYALYRIGKIWNLLDKYTTEKLVHAFVTSRLDYCNNLLMGLPGNQICKLQSVQNAAALQYTHWKYADGLGETFFQPRCHVESS